MHLVALAVNTKIGLAFKKSNYLNRFVQMRLVVYFVVVNYLGRGVKLMKKFHNLLQRDIFGEYIAIFGLNYSIYCHIIQV